MADLLAPMRFASGGVSSKSTSPELCHFLIRDGYIIGYDGMLAMCCQIPIELNMKPKAAELLNAVKACPENATVALSKTAAGKLSVKAGKFKAFVNCLPDDYVLSIPAPEGQMVPATSDLLPAIQAAIPFCADGKGPNWSQGLRFKGNKVYATNSIVLIEKEHGCAIPHEFIIPVAAAAQLLKMKDPITALQVGANSVTFYFGLKWMRTSIIDGKWPANVEPMFDIPGEQEAIVDGFFANVKTIAAVPLSDESTPRIYLREGIMSNSPSDEVGCALEQHVAPEGIFPQEQLLLLEGVMTHCAWGTYPKPCSFRGEKLRGILLGFQR